MSIVKILFFIRILKYATFKQMNAKITNNNSANLLLLNVEPTLNKKLSTRVSSIYELRTDATMDTTNNEYSLFCMILMNALPNGFFEIKL